MRKKKFRKAAALLLAAAAAVTALVPCVHPADAASRIKVTRGTLYRYSDYGLGSYLTYKYAVSMGDITSTAYCIEPEKASPYSGDWEVTRLKDGKALAKVCYYGTKASGENGFFTQYYPEKSAGERFVITHLAAAYAYQKDDAFKGANTKGKTLAKKLYNYCLKQPDIPDVDMEFSDDDVKAYVKGNIQRTKTVKFTADKLQTITMKLPKNVKLVNVTTGNTSKAGADVEISGGTKFYLTAPVDQSEEVKGIWQTKMKGSIIKDYAAYKVSTGSGSQNLAFVFGEGVDNEKYVDFTVRWVHPSRIELTKKDNDTGKPLAGAEFGVYQEKDCKTLLAKMPKTDRNGKSNVEFYTGGNTVYVKELTAPAEYAVAKTVQSVGVSEEKTSQVSIGDDRQRYGVSVLVQKIDKGTGKAAAEGAATLKDAEFTMKFYENVKSDADPAASGTKPTRTWVFATDENGTIKYDKEHLVSGDGLFADHSGKPYLPLGTLTMQETKAPEGYKADSTVYVRNLKASGTEVVAGNVAKENVKEQVLRGDLKLRKISNVENKPMAEIPFRITSKTTGESHVIYTDKNGNASTEASYVKHTAHTNEGKTAADGVWFGTDTPDDQLGALPYDSYTLQELRCENNRGTDLIKKEFSIDDKTNGTVTADSGTLTDYFAQIKTEAVDQKSGTHYAKAEDNVTIMDTVSYAGLTKGQKYRLSGILMDRATGKPVQSDGKAVASEAEFTAEDRSGTTKVEFHFKGTELKGHAVVAYEELFKGNERYAEHKKLTDEGQTVYFPEVHTTASDAKTGTHTSCASKSVTLTDQVAYRGLAAGKTYTLSGTLMDKKTGKAIQVNGKPVTAERKFVPENTDGSVSLTFVFDGSTLAGKTTVVFEKIYQEETGVAAHADLKDADQTIHFPKIHTTAWDQADGDHKVKAEKKTVVIDTVNYSNLTAGKEYKVSGTLMDKKTGKPVQKDGKPITAKTSFKAEKTFGSEEVKFVFNSLDLEGHSTVVFEKLYEAGKEIAMHEDLKDKGQTVDVETTHHHPTAKTEFYDSGSISHPKTGDRKLPVGSMVVLIGAAAMLTGLVAYRLKKRKQ